MAVPKRRTSKQRKRIRRSHDGMSMPSLSRCPKCENAVMPHRACPRCGEYRGRVVINMEEE